MATIYLVRHAQAGTRENYDVLSELGLEQARRLGEHLAAQKLELDAVYAGGLNRQRLTAEIACRQLVRAGLKVPDVQTDERWNEFSLLSVYRAIAKRMVEEDEQFAADVREMQEAIRRDPHTTGGATGRCDQAVIRAWMENRYPDYEGETWTSFRTRIQACDETFCNHEAEQTIAVFTSATPVAILSGAALGLTDDRLANILGVIYNTSVTMMKHRRGELRLFTFNSVSHLDSTTRTWR